MVYPIGYALTMGFFFATIFYSHMVYVPDFISMVEQYNHIGYSKLHYPLHVSVIKQRRHALLYGIQRLVFCPLEYGVYSDVINLDRYNLFLLGLAYMSFKSLLYGLLAVPMLSCHVTRCALAAVKAFCLSKPRKPPDKATDSFQCLEGGYIACSSTIREILHVDSVYTESFDSEDLVLIRLDSLCSRHLFPAKSDFISEIKPIGPFDIHGVGGNIKAIGQGTVWLCFHYS